MENSRRRRVCTSVLSAAIFVIFNGCGGGGGGGNGPTGPGGRGACEFAEPPPNFPDRTATFTPSSGASVNTITLRQGSNCPDLLVLEIFAVNMSDLAGVQYTLGFPTNALGFDSSRLGPFLTESGTVQVSGGGGISSTLQRPAGQAGVTGSGQIILVAWVYQGITGTFNITLQGQAFDSTGNSIAGTTFIGGSVTIS